MSSIKTIDTYSINGFVGVDVKYNDDVTGDIRDDVELGSGITGLSPRGARALAIDLLKSADRVDGGKTAQVKPRKRYRMA